ncbi:Glucokinase (EC [Olavius algarvensis associated proteobacterium Delta 3]|nr:Glucokinase (EC [Olavius algarvensis associated proteobacterium Delta 3]CAB5155792.1 Glucokinase (EC [Olavius algarvensis associated proteobacterium Delta 3]
MTTDKWYIAGDIGGTKTNLGCFLPGRARPRLVYSASFPSREFSDLETILALFMERHPDYPVAGACFGIAGPVVGGRSRTTNLPWLVSEGAIQRRFDWPKVRLVNDLVATAMAVPVLNPREVASVNPNRIQKSGNMALVAPGTGLGLALLIADNGRHIPVASEGGHAGFAPGDDDEIDLWQHLRSTFGHVSAERVLSGQGLVNIFQWLKDSVRYREPRWLAAARASGDPARAISDAALLRKTPIAVAALDRFVTILGALSGDFALTGMAFGGVYLGGGIPPRIRSVILDGPFQEAFTRKGRFTSMMEKTAVKIILNDRAALLGAAIGAME